MDPSHYAQAMSLFGQLMDAEDASIEDALAGVEPALAESVRALLAHDARTSLLLDGPVPTPDVAPGPPQVEGFAITRVLGEGATGVVYEAEQAEPRRRVALKILHPWLSASAALQLFRREADALASLRHPGIPQVYEVGTATERVYICMELVRGGDLRAACRDRPLRAIAALLAAICRTAHHAHLRGLVHRDLKPENIAIDEEGSPKILDFGLALDPVVEKALTPGLVGTLGYMAPEQLRQQPVDLRADVYALGVIAYELCEGCLPWALDGLDFAAAVAQVKRPPRPPTRVPHDLAAVLERALRAEPDQRYPDAQALGEDLDRFARGEAVSAVSSPVYRASRWLRANRLVAGLASTLVLALSLGLGATQSARARAEQAQRDAAAEAEQSAEVTAFLRELLTASHPRLARGEEVTVRMALDQAIARLDAAPIDPDVDFELRATFFGTLWALGDKPAALAQAEAVAALAESGRLQDPDHRISYEHLRGELALIDGRNDEAREHLERALAAEIALHGDAHDHVAQAAHGLGTLAISDGDYDAAEAHLERSIRIREALGNPREPFASTLAGSVSQLARVYERTERRAEAEALHRQALALDRADLGEVHSDVAVRWHHLAQYLYEERRDDEALAALDEASRIRAEVLAPDHWRLASQELLRAMLLDRLGRTAEAVPVIDAAMGLYAAGWGPDHLETAVASEVQVQLYLAVGRDAEAAAIARRSLAVLEPAGHPKAAALRALLDEATDPLVAAD